MSRRHLRVLLFMFAVVALGDLVPAAQASPCTRQCRLIGLACRVPFQVAFKTQRAACERGEASLHRGSQDHVRCRPNVVSGRGNQL